MKNLNGVRFFFVIGYVYLSLGASLLQAEDWKPRSQHYQAQESRVECSVYRSVYTSTKETLNRRISDFKELTVSTKKYFEVLRECREKNGINSVDISDSDSKAAEACGESYDSWLLEGTHLITVEEEIAKLREELSTLQGAVSRKCLPTMVAELK
ncbi:MAG: hypothetical protein FJ116_10620 [Deltaproteobacteria bacterium]|nr:hypothetical protein [Deltaproteobacteria bacterium]